MRTLSNAARPYLFENIYGLASRAYEGLSPEWNLMRSTWEATPQQRTNVTCLCQLNSGLDYESDLDQPCCADDCADNRARLVKPVCRRALLLCTLAGCGRSAHRLHRALLAVRHSLVAESRSLSLCPGPIRSRAAPPNARLAGRNGDSPYREHGLSPYWLGERIRA